MSFTSFKEDISAYKLPEKIAYPFNYDPCDLAKLASKELQELIVSKTDWNHDFGLTQHIDSTNIGKMFGVLVVKNSKGNIGYLKAFSGKVADVNVIEGFVPPIAEFLNKGSFYRQGEEELVAINKIVIQKENDLKNSKQILDQEGFINRLQSQLKQHKALMKSEKVLRDNKRIGLDLSSLNDEEVILIESLKQESLKLQFDLKKIKKELRITNEELDLLKQSILEEVQNLKIKRKQKSRDLQKQMFSEYNFLNEDHDQINLFDIFKDTKTPIPPSGAGDCAAPKLFNYAFKNKLKPIALAEFWWGQSPKSDIKIHKNYYPSCRSKCFPILSFMLNKSNVEPNPLEEHDTDKCIEIIHDEALFTIINKPEGLLSVPGKKVNNSAYSQFLKKFPEATGPIIVHRLDMHTSGLMVLTKNKETHKYFQNLFLNKEIKKEYYALLESIPKTNSGTIDLPLRVDLENRPRQLVCHEHGKKAISEFEVLESKGSKVLVRFSPLTGRTHQLRVHAAHLEGLNSPILGDDLYGKPKDRLYLHAYKLTFIHPITNKPVNFEVKPQF